MKTALVTGGAVRLGRAICERFASAGWGLLLHYHRSAAEAEALAARLAAEHGVPVQLLQADLARAEAVDDLGRRAAAHGLDVLVNGAAIFHPTRTLAESLAAWQAFMTVNLETPFRLAAACAGALRERRGAIVNMADIYAATPLPGYLPYSISKSGVVALTRSLAVELAPDVRVNAVAPGAILLAADAGPERAAQLAAAVPLGRMGEPSDIADAVYYLATAPYVTGQVLAVDGGRSLRI